MNQTILPRLLALRGNPRSAVFLGGIGERERGQRPIHFPHDLIHLAELIVPHRGMGGAFVVIDPVSALYPAVVAASEAAVRQAIEPLIQSPPTAARASCSSAT